MYVVSVYVPDGSLSAETFQFQMQHLKQGNGRFPKPQQDKMDFINSPA